MPAGTHREPLAIVGIDCLFPGSTDARGFWADVLEGNDQLRDVPESHWLIDDHFDPDPGAEDRTYGKRGAFLDPVELDPVSWGLPPKTLEATDTAQLLALIVAQRVLTDAARGQFAELDRSRVSVILGVTGGQELLGTMVARLERPVWVKALREAGLSEDQVQAAVRRILDHYVPWQEATFPGLLGNVVAGRIANKLDLGGTNCITDAACASSISALSMAANELYLGDSDLVITGGVDTMNDAFMYVCFSKTMALSPSGDCRPFSDAADGTMLGEGIGMLALKRLGDAERDGDAVYATIRGLGASSDGGGTAVYAPVAAGQARALRRAYGHAGYGPETVELVEAHGTGTKAGDAAEFAGLRTVFAESGRTDRGWCSLGSVKSLIGHTKAAAGAAGVIKAVLALHGRALPPMPKMQSPNPDLGLAESPFSLSVTARPWIRGDDHERRASVSSFGFGGSNFHVTLSESTGVAPRAARLRAVDAELVVLTGDLEEVRRRAKDLADAPPLEGTLRWLSATSAAAWSPQAPARLAIVARDEQDLADKLRRAEALLAAGRAFDAPGMAFGTGPPDSIESLAFLFPGQGSQELRMGSALAMAFDAAIAAWDKGDGFTGGERLSSVVFPPTAFETEAAEEQEARLRATEWAQPALACASLAQLAVLGTLGLRPAFTAGHSFGELTALHSAGAFDAATLMSLACARGRAMHDAATTPGAMLAVACSLTAIGEHLEAWGSAVTVANHNGPEQVVLSGGVDDIDRVEARCREAGFTMSRPAVATAFHSPLVAEAADTFARALSEHDLGPPQIPTYSNVTAGAYESSVAAIRSGLASQLSHPVRFVEMVERMYADGARTFVEVGPGSVLTGLVGAILEAREHRAVALDRRGSTGISRFLEGIAMLAAAGLPMELTALWRGYRRPVDPADRPRPKLAVPISGHNLGRRYPTCDGMAAVPAPDHDRRDTAPGFAPSPPPLAVEGRRAATHPDGLGLPGPATIGAHPPAAAGGAPTLPPARATEAPAAPAGPGDWLQADGIDGLHEHVARAHASCMETLGRMHEAYLDTYARLAGTPDANVAAPPPPRAAAWLAPVTSFDPVPTPTHGNGDVPSGVSAPGTTADMSTPQVVPLTGPVPAMPELAEDLIAVMLEVVADKTGYPADMLDLGMELEADLGIDSIKRVEILSGLRDRVPGLPEVDVSALAELATLGQIAAFVRAAPGGATTPSAPARVGPAAPVTDLARRELKVVERRAPGLAMGALWQGPIVVCDDGTPLAGLIVAGLEKSGVMSRVVAEVPGDAFGVVLLAAATSQDGATDALVRGLVALRPVAARLASSPGLLVTVQDTGGTFGVATTDAGGGWGGGLAGLARTAAMEWPQVSVKAIDVQRAGLSDEQVARSVVDELLGGGTQLDVGLTADGRRWSATTRDAEPSTGSGGLRAEDVVVVSGGGRGITAACAVALAEQTGALFVLLGRTRLEEEAEWLADVHGDAEIKKTLLAASAEAGEPPTPAQLGARARQILAAREVRATLARIRDVGSSAVYETVDVTDASAVATVLGAVRERWGAITALVHGAGVLADRRIEDTSTEDARRVVATKVDGLASLLAATAADDLRLLCVFSSVSARYGNAGQAGYAMANETLNKIAQAERRRRGPSCLIRAIAWGPWDGGMVAPALAAHFRARGVGLIPVEVGAKAFVHELSSDPATEVEVELSVRATGELPATNHKPARASVLTGTARQPYLTDHAIDGRVVVPAALALEWFARAAGELWPDRRVDALADFRVLAGVRPGPTELVTIVEEHDGVMGMRSSGGRPAYRCRTASADDHPRLTERLVGEAPPGTRVPYGERLPHGGRALFHGPSFQVIASIEGIDATGIRATLHSAPSMGWEPEPWRLDPALVDGVVQVLVVWMARQHRVASIPTSIDYVRWGPDAATPGTAACSCELWVRDESAQRAVADAVVDVAGGARLLDLRGITVHALPG